MAEAVAVVSIVSAIAGFAGQQKQRKEMRKATETAQAEERKQRAIANRQAQIERRRQIRMSIAASRVTRAQIVNQSFGVGGSATEGTGSAIQTDLGSAIGSAQTQGAAQAGIALSQDRQSGALQDFQNAQGGNFLTGISDLGKAATSVMGIWGGGNPFAPSPAAADTTPLFGVAR